jgi:hypothetical protein
MSQFARQACKQYNEVCSSLLWFRLKDILLNPRVSFSISSLFFIFHPGVLDVPGAISLPHPMRQERTLFIIVL